MGGHREKQIAPLLTSNRPHFNVPPLRDSLLCYSQVWAPFSLLHVFMYLYRERRRYSVLTWDKCFIQMLLSHIVQEVMNSCAAASRPGSPCQAWARGRRSSTAAKLNLMFNPLQERCINQSFWFAWSVASNLIPCKNKPGQNMMSEEKQCNLRLPNKNKQQAGPFNSDCCSDVKYIIKNTAPSGPPLSFKERGSHLKSWILFSPNKKNETLNLWQSTKQAEDDNVRTSGHKWKHTKTLLEQSDLCGGISKL